MKQFSRILVGTDLSEEADYALRTGLELSARLEQKLCIVHAIPENLREVRGSDVNISRTDIQEEVNQRAHRIAAEIPGVDPETLQLEIHTRFGKPAEVVREVAEEIDSDLIILGRHGRHMLEHLFLGSTTAKVTRETDAAILITRDDRTLNERYRETLAAIDFTDLSVDLLSLAGDITRMVNGRLHVLHVYETLGLYEYTSMTPNLPTSRYDQKMAEEARDTVEGLIEQAGIADLKPSRYVRPGLPAGEILYQSEELGVDLVIIGSNCRTGIDRVLLGNTADRVMRRVDADILVMKA